MMGMNIRALWLGSVLVAVAGCASGGNYVEWPRPAAGELASTGRNPYFVLEPGYQLTLESKAGDRLVVTVLKETKMVDGVETRVIEERETEGGQLAEVSRNYYAMGKTSKDVFYFGEDVDIYKDGKVTSHEGSWLAGVGGARAGLMMPGKAEAGMKFMQEVAPKVAMDQCEIVSVSEKVTVAVGTYSDCVKVADSSAIGKEVPEEKVYAPGVGLVMEEDYRLVKFGMTGQ